MGYHAPMCNGNTEHADERYTHGSPLPVEKRAHVDSPRRTQLKLTLHSSAHRCGHTANTVCVKPVVSSLDLVLLVWKNAVKKKK